MRRPVLVLAILVLTTLPAVAQQNPPAEENIEVRITVRSPASSEAIREYSMILSPNVASRLHAGRKIPIPTTTFNTSQTVGSSIVPVTSFTYQNIGFAARLTASRGTGDVIRLEGEIEDSRVVEEGEHPVIESISQFLAANLEPGAPLVVNRIGGARDAAVSIEVVALDGR